VNRGLAKATESRGESREQEGELETKAEALRQELRGPDGPNPLHWKERARIFELLGEVGQRLKDIELNYKL
jgi:hypothetical protein